MFLLRIVGLLAVTAIAASALLYLFTRDRKYLTIALRITRYSVMVALAVFTLLLIERLAVLV